MNPYMPGSDMVLQVLDQEPVEPVDVSGQTMCISCRKNGVDVKTPVAVRDDKPYRKIMKYHMYSCVLCEIFGDFDKMMRLSCAPFLGTW